MWLILRVVAARAGSVLPQLIALYLAGEVLHDLFFKWAVEASAVNPLFPVALLPLGLLARLFALLGMLLLMRPAITRWDADADTPPPARRELAASMTAAVLPFMAFYVAGNYLANDYRDFQFDAFNKTVFLPKPDATAWALGVAGVLLLLRAILKRRNKQLPSWALPLVFYVEAAWVYLLLDTWLRDFDLDSWLSSRRVVVGFQLRVHEVLEHLPGAKAVWDAAAWLIGEVVAVSVVPLGWLTLAGVVYALVPTTTTWADARRAVLRGRGETLSQAAQRTGAGNLLRPFREQASALRDALYVMLNMGVVPFAGYILTFTGLAWLFGNMSEDPARYGWVNRQIAAALGPREVHWWQAVNQVLYLVPNMVQTILQICLIAIVYAAFVRGVRRAPAATPAPVDSADGAVTVQAGSAP